MTEVDSPHSQAPTLVIQDVRQNEANFVTNDTIGDSSKILEPSRTCLHLSNSLVHGISQLPIYIESPQVDPQDSIMSPHQEEVPENTLNERWLAFPRPLTSKTTRDPQLSVKAVRFRRPHSHKIRLRWKKRSSTTVESSSRSELSPHKLSGDDRAFSPTLDVDLTPQISMNIPPQEEGIATARQHFIPSIVGFDEYGNIPPESTVENGLSRPIEQTQIVPETVPSAAPSISSLVFKVYSIKFSVNFILSFIDINNIDAFSTK